MKILWVLCCLAVMTPVAALADDVDLLDKATLEAGIFANGDPGGVAALKDDDPTTVAVFPAGEDGAVELVFRLTDDVAAPTHVMLDVPSGAGQIPPGRIDVLVSTLSETMGFSSVRTETIDGLNAEEKLKLQPSAAGWMMVKLFPRPGETSVALGGLHIMGAYGPPVSAYEFGTSPAEALALIQSLRAFDPEVFALDPGEEALFRDATEGAFSVDAFETMALHASGVTSKTDREGYRARIDTLEAALRGAIDLSAPADAKGAALLDWLHQTVLTNGYVEEQTDLDRVLDDGVFNCVSSAVIYVALAQRLGLDARAIEVPDHAFAILYDGADHSDVETTTPRGFDPRRDKVAEFEALTGFTYIPQSNKSKRREIGMRGLAALIYYNHGVEALREERFDDALLANFRALSLDPEFASAVTNAVAALGQWSIDAADKGNWDQAVEIAGIGATLAPNDRGLATRQVAVWQKWAEAKANGGDLEGALKVLQRAGQAVEDKRFAEMQAFLVLRQADALADAKDWAAALEASAADGLSLTPEASAHLVKWQRNLYLRWANSEIENRAFASARDVLAAGLDRFADDSRLRRSVRFVAQEGAAGATSFGDGIVFLREVKTQFPSETQLDGIVERYVYLMMQKSGDADVTAQLALVRAAENLFSNPRRFTKMAAGLYDRKGRPFLDAMDWPAAAAIYSEGLRAFGDDYTLTNNARYLAQQWQKSAFEDGGAEALAKVNGELRVLFPDFSGKRGFGEGEVRRQVAALADAGQIDEARAALDEAQLVLSAKTYQDMSVYVIDRHARPMFDSGNWADAAAIYAEGLQRFPDDHHLKRNALFIAQEWTNAAEADGGVEAVTSAMASIREMFPGNKRMADMGVKTLRRSVFAHLEAGRLDEARTMVATARPSLPDKEAEDLTVALFTGIGQQMIDARDWAGALEAYGQGQALYPDAYKLRQNEAYILQEWIADSYSAAGVEGLIATVAAIGENGVEDRVINRSVEGLVGREVNALLSQSDYKAALAMVDATNEVLSKSSRDRLLVAAYDGWARAEGEAGDWARAVAIYDDALADVGNNGILMNNRRWAAGQ